CQQGYDYPMYSF
nr:immunoglobulin light chain junction region [Macaca mulatta]MOV62597.1 immunoglobulin light chain junction region [Macaca mulatta]MOV62886.1 immunoglobulin light chain junction region [Macaca mulatta]MOV64703.1 immunoglobulin light chain junction region [Macaca mulatta]MOV65081.1 immunoglobulin light chain junction region [Macaca mulatta]